MSMADACLKAVPFPPDDSWHERARDGGGRRLRVYVKERVASTTTLGNRNVNYTHASL